MNQQITKNLIFGTARLHHIRKFDLFSNLINEVINRGINKFDIAPLYGYGITEQNLSKLLSNKNCYLNTKTGLYVPKLFFYNLFEYWLKFIINKYIPKNNLATIEKCQSQIIKTCNLFKDKAIVNSICLHEPRKEFILNQNKILPYFYFLKKILKEFNIDHIGISGEHVFYCSNNNSLLFETVQTSAKVFLSSSEECIIKTLINSKELNLYGLSIVNKKDLKIKLKDIISSLEKKIKVNLIFSTKYPHKLNNIIGELASIIDYVH